MDNNNTQQTIVPDPYFDDIKAKTAFSFDFVLWFYRLLKYWYLFVLSVPIFLGIAYFENKSWVPVYGVGAIIMLEARGNSGITNAIPMGTILRDATNQSILLSSYEMTQRTVNNLPQKMFVDYYVTDRFKTINLYDTKPVKIDTILFLTDEAYHYEYNMAPVDNESCKIYYDANEENGIPAFSIVVPYDKVIETKNFTIRLRKTRHYKENFTPYSFRFLNKDNLMGMFFGRIAPNLSDDNSSILNVSMGGPVPQRDVDFLTILLDQFQKYNLFLKNEQADLTINFINLQLGIINDSLALSREQLDQFQRMTGVYEVSSPTLKQEINAADNERDNILVNEKALLTLTQIVTDAILEDKELIIPNNFINSEDASFLTEYVTQYNELLVKYRNLGAKNPIYEKKVQEINVARTNILEFLQREQATLQEKKDLLVDKYELLDLKIENLPPQERDLLMYNREYKTYEMYDQFLRQKKQEAGLQKASNIADNYIWEPPRITGGPFNGKEKDKAILFYLFTGLLVPLVFIILKEEVFNFTLSTKEECEKLSGFTVIGTIENVGKKFNKGVVLVKNYPKSSFAESFRNMRVRIEYLAQRESKITTLVTSSEPADGKTFIATNIASVYQLMGKKVAIIDLDLRRPSVSKTLQIESQRGVSNYLIGQVTLDEIIIEHPDYGFDILPAGTLPPNPSELIKTDKTKELLQILKERYDYVVVDCSPVGLVSDAYILAKLVDATLFVVRRAKTNKSFFKSVVNQLKLDGIDNVALVFNDVKGREGYYGTSRYYGDKTYYLKKNSYYHDDYFEN